MMPDTHERHDSGMIDLRTWKTLRDGLLTAGLAASIVAAAPAVAADADFYAGKSIQVLIAFSSGGGYDIYARSSPAIWRATSPAIHGSSRRTCRGPAASRRSTISITSRPGTAR
jgi:hypothetical protein